MLRPCKPCMVLEVWRTELCTLSTACQSMGNFARSCCTVERSFEVGASCAHQIWGLLLQNPAELCRTLQYSAESCSSFLSLCGCAWSCSCVAALNTCRTTYLASYKNGGRVVPAT
jgi:hypothetical protein